MGSLGFSVCTGSIFGGVHDGDTISGLAVSGGSGALVLSLVSIGSSSSFVSLVSSSAIGMDPESSGASVATSVSGLGFPCSSSHSSISSFTFCSSSSVCGMSIPSSSFSSSSTPGFCFPCSSSHVSILSLMASSSSSLFGTTISISLGSALLSFFSSVPLSDVSSLAFWLLSSSCFVSPETFGPPSIQFPISCLARSVIVASVP
mmetsp:Transcript_10391/g.26132  ORF Transcript_10391/g.26132 Transcript_10391/m.26132 type:complete len:204 (+) Transcript_10391:576-1187(+)